MSNSFDPEMIQKMAKNIAQQHMDKITSNIMQDDGSCDIGAQQEIKEKKYPSQEQMKITRDNIQQVFEKAQTITCEQCDNHIFTGVVIIKRISPLISPTGEEVIMPVQTYQCTECKYINSQFLPQNATLDVKQ